MPIERTKVVARTGRGGLSLIEDALPPLGPHDVLIDVHRSLVSPGTELGGGWAALRRERDDPKPLETPRPIGYSNAGVVRRVGAEVSKVSVGQRVAAVGAGYARHAVEAVVPENLVVQLPDGVTFEAGSFAMLAATALHAVRRTDVSLGEYSAVLGLGLVGQLTAALLRLSGTYVIGWDLMPTRCRTAERMGIAATCPVADADPVAATERFTGGAGLDHAVVAIAGEATSAIGQVERCMKLSPDGHRTGVITIVGGIHLDYRGETTNIDYRRASRTGPGYHDEMWERGGDYPHVFVRWTTRSNIELCLRLIAEGRLDPAPLVTHTIPIDDCESRVDALLDDCGAALGVLFAMR